MKVRKLQKLLRTIRPFSSALAVVATASALVVAIYFTENGRLWVTFLAGVLVATTLAEATRWSHARWIVTRRSAQLSAMKAKLERETELRKQAENAVAADKPRLHLIDEVLPTMVAFVDRKGHCRYHNRAFLNWLNLRPEQISGRHMRDVLGSQVYQETAAAVRQSLDGHAVHYERTQQMPDGAVYRLAVEHLPEFGDDGKASGFFMLISDITKPDDVRLSAAHDASDDQSMFVDEYSEQTTGQHDAGMIRSAIENGEFSLLCQLITPLVAKGGIGHYEILVRLNEDEGSMLPPGTFFPLAEKYGLMTHLDRWVTQHVAEWLSRQMPRSERQQNTTYFINVSGATIADPGFSEFLNLTLLEYNLPASTLCFEIPDSELAMRTAEVAEFARQVRRSGCRVALSGFGRDQVLFNLIRGFQVEFLKIDGSMILGILRDPLKLAKLTAISRVAKKIGVQTIAELVENEETVASLRKVGIDFAQGFGISRPRSLQE
ncbi:MAG: EAL domain-containing protein [Gallionella sp.]